MARSPQLLLAVTLTCGVMLTACSSKESATPTSSTTVASAMSGATATGPSGTSTTTANAGADAPAASGASGVAGVPESPQPATATLAAQEYARKNRLPDTVAPCLATELTASLGENGAKAAMRIDGGPADETQLKALAPAADKCITPRQLGDSLAESLISEMQVAKELTAGIGPCFEQRFTGKVGAVVAASAGPTNPFDDPNIGPAVDACVTGDAAAAVVVTLTGVTFEGDQRTCVIGKVSGKVPVSKMFVNDQPTLDQVRAALTDCGVPQ